MAIVGCYDLHLYCDSGGDPYGSVCPQSMPWEATMQEINGRNERDCYKQARAVGWKINTREQTAFCPKCAKEANRRVK